MKNVTFFVISAIALLVITGCSISRNGIPKSDVALDRKNFRVLETNLRGVDTGWSLFCMIPFDAPTYADAMLDLHQKIGMIGQARALANVTGDQVDTCYLIFSREQVMISTDIVEFLDE